jgi:hypothetical protein
VIRVVHSNPVRATVLRRDRHITTPRRRHTTRGPVPPGLGRCPPTGHVSKSGAGRGSFDAALPFPIPPPTYDLPAPTLSRRRRAPPSRALRCIETWHVPCQSLSMSETSSFRTHKTATRRRYNWSSTSCCAGYTELVRSWSDWLSDEELKAITSEADASGCSGRRAARSEPREHRLGGREFRGG